jgi:ribosomal protein S27AE
MRPTRRNQDMSDLWTLMLLVLYLEDSERFERPQTEKVRTYYYECPECGRRWGDEYSAPRFCPNCGIAPRETFRLVDRLTLIPNSGHCACIGSE